MQYGVIGNYIVYFNFNLVTNNYFYSLPYKLHPYRQPMKRSSAAQIQHKFEPNQILYLIGDVNYSSVYLCDGTIILSSRTLKWYHTKWPHFIRIHKATLINPLYIQSCSVLSCILAQITMQNGVTMTISRRRIHDVLEHLQQPYMRSEIAQWNDYAIPEIKLA